MLNLKGRLLQLCVNDLEKLSSKSQNYDKGQVVGYIDDTVADNDSGAESIDDVESDFDVSENESERRYIPWRSPCLARKFVQNVKYSPALVRKAIEKRRKIPNKKEKSVEIFSLALAVAHHSGHARSPWHTDRVEAWTSMGEDMQQYLYESSDSEDEEDSWCPDEIRSGNFTQLKEITSESENENDGSQE